MPFIRGLWLHYLSDLNIIKPISSSKNFTIEVLEQDKIIELLNIKGFNEAVIYDANHPYQTELVMVTRKGDEVVGVTGGCKPCSKLWQIGVDVLQGYQGLALTAYIVNCLMLEILNRSYVPSYSTMVSNIASQRVAYRVGYYAAWVSDWRCNFQALET